MDPLLDIAANYGLPGFLVAAIIYIVNRFDSQLTKRDERDATKDALLIKVVEDVTAAVTELSTIIKARKG